MFVGEKLESTAAAAAVMRRVHILTVNKKQHKPISRWETDKHTSRAQIKKQMNEHNQNIKACFLDQEVAIVETLLAWPPCPCQRLADSARGQAPAQ